MEVRHQKEFCTKEGAECLKALIEEYWKERGYAVRAQLIENKFIAAMRSARTDIRSDMVDGLPRRRLAA